MPQASRDGLAATSLRPEPARSRLATFLLGASLVLVALNLRTPITSVGPVLPEIVQSQHLSALGASILTTLPALCFGFAGAGAPILARGLGTEQAVLAALLALALGTGLRGIASVPAVFLGQILACCAIGVVNVLLPGIVKHDFPRRVALMTGLYTMALTAGAAAAAGATVPLVHALGGSWATALAFWAAPAALAAALWTPRLRGQAEGGGRTVLRVRGLWTDALAWQVTLFMGFQAALAYIVFGWLAPMLRDRGLSAVDAGLILSLSVVVQAAAALVAPVLATRGRDQRLWNAGAVALCLVGLLGCFWAPLSTVWIWALLLGVAQGSLFALALTLLVLRAADAHVAAHLSSMAQGVGYVLTAAGPLLAGLLHGWTGGWNAVAVLCIAIGLGAALSGFGAGRSAHVRAAHHR